MGGVTRHMLPHLPGVPQLLCKQALKLGETNVKIN